MVYGNGSLKVGNGTKKRDVRGIGSLTLVCGGGEQGFGGGPARGEGTLEYRTSGGDIPHQGGGGKRSCWSGPEKEGGPLLKYTLR